MSRRKGKNAPESDQDPPLYFRTDVTPEEIFQAIGRLRKEARNEIDRLIGFLDKTDDYVSRELEDSNDDEPSLGWTTQRIGRLKARANSKSRWSWAGTAMIAPVP